MKFIKLYESFNRYEKVLKDVEQCKINDTLPESIIYQYVEYLNDKSCLWTHEECFIDGDLGDRIEKYNTYVLKEVPIDLIDLEEFTLQDDISEEYAKEYEKTGKYPPIVLTDDYQIIDGNHRVNALYSLGIDEILAFVGV